MTVISERRARILEAVAAKSFTDLRSLSLEAEGLATARQEAWYAC